MKICFRHQTAPQTDQRIVYQREGDRIKVFLSDSRCLMYDFTDMPDGHLINGTVRPDVNIEVLISAKKENGILYLELLNWLGHDAKDDEWESEWMDFEDYEAPKDVKQTALSVTDVVFEWKSQEELDREREEEEKKKQLPTTEEKLEKAEKELEATKQELALTQITMDNLLTEVIPSLFM